MDCGSIDANAKINRTFCFSNPGRGSRRYRWPVRWWRVVSGHESTRMEPISNGVGVGLGHLVRLDGDISLDGVGFHEGSGTDSPGMVGRATDIEYRLVVDVFWVESDWLGTRSDGHLASCCIDDHQNIPTNATRSLQFNDACACLAGIRIGVEFCAMANKWRWIEFAFLKER